MRRFQINVERDSVCMGDDVDAPHSYVFHLPFDASMYDVFEHLAKKRYLAYVAGKNHSWEAIIDFDAVAFFKGNAIMPEPSPRLQSSISNYANNQSLNIRFKYNSSAT